MITAAELGDSSMTSDGTPAQDEDRRKGLQSTVRKLVEQRQQVIVNYCQLVGVGVVMSDDIDADDVAISVENLRKFLDLLVDYTALGHFEIYQRIIEGKERRRSVQEASNRVYPGIAETTDFLVDFNDKYDGFDGEASDQAMLAKDLPKLGQVLSLRAELEDEILAALQR